MPLPSPKNCQRLSLPKFFRLEWPEGLAFKAFYPFPHFPPSAHKPTWGVFPLTTEQVRYQGYLSLSLGPLQVPASLHMPSSPDPGPHLPVLKQHITGASVGLSIWPIQSAPSLTSVGPRNRKDVLWHLKNLCWIELNSKTVSCLSALAYEDLVRDPEVLMKENQSLPGIKGIPGSTEKYWGLGLCRPWGINETCVKQLRSQQCTWGRPLFPTCTRCLWACS